MQWSTGSISGLAVPSGGTGPVTNPHRRPEVLEVDADGGELGDVSLDSGAHFRLFALRRGVVFSR